jgi:hypothetical protein
MNVDIVASRIRVSIEATSKMLNSVPLRMEIDGVITQRQYVEKDALAQMTAAELAVFLGKVVIGKWPGQPEWGFQAIEEKLKPLKEIGALLNSDAINEFVRVRDNPCVQADSRVPLQDFKKALWQRLFTGPTDPQQLAPRD